MTHLSESVQLAIVSGGFTLVTTLLVLIFRVTIKTHEAVNSRLDSALNRVFMLEDLVRQTGVAVPEHDASPSVPKPS